MAHDRITTDPDQMGGQPCIRGLRIPVATVVTMVADGMSVDGPHSIGIRESRLHGERQRTERAV